MDGLQPPQTTSRRLNHLLLYSPIIPLTGKRDFNLAFSFLFLLISSLALFSLLAPLVDLRFRLPSRDISPKSQQTRPQSSCDYSKGRWVWDETASSSSSSIFYDESCPFLDPGFQCIRNGRKDVDYVKWRWQPDDCDLPRFDASDLLERSRDGRIVFAGDSIGRNQWESLMCMLSRAVPNISSSIYEENGNPITKHKGYLSMRFDDYNLTVEYYRAPFLARTRKPPLDSLPQVRMALRVDELHPSKKRWVGADVVVFNAGHWWNQDKTVKMGFYFQEGGHVDMAMNVTEAFRRSLLTWKSWVMNKFDLERSHVFFRSYAPTHFSNGKWDEGGRCNHTKPDMKIIIGKGRTEAAEYYNLHITNAIKEMKSSSSSSRVRFLNITFLTDMRKDGHPSNNREPGTPAETSEDCSHWCLPGVPDTWNQILYAHLLSDGFRKNLIA